METAHRYSDASCQCRHCAKPLFEMIEARFTSLAESGKISDPELTEEQRECLCDPGRADEAWAMLDDWEARGYLVGSERGEVAAFITRAETDSSV